MAATNWNLPVPSAMDTTGDVLTNWNDFKETWENYVTATKLDEEDAAVQVATLLTVIGKECRQIQKNLPLSEADRKDPERVLQALEGHFKPKQNVIYERYVFNSRVQGKDEKFDAFISDIRKLVASCDFGDMYDQMLRDRIVFGVKDNNTRGKLLGKSDLTLEKAIDMCRSAEITAAQLKTFDNESVHYSKSKDFGTKHRKSTQYHCTYCGEVHRKGNCAAYGHVCKKCGRSHHFEKVCRSNESQDKYDGKKMGHKQDKYNGKKMDHKRRNKLHQVQEETEEEDESSDSVYTIFGTPQKSQYFTEVKVSAVGSEDTIKVSFQVDAGATCSTLTMGDYRKIPNVKLQPSSKRLSLYGKKSEIIIPEGTVKLHCVVNGIRKKVHFEVIEDAPVSLLSGKACAALNIVQFNEECVRHVSSNNMETSKENVKLAQEDIMSEYKDVFIGLGKLPGTYHIEIDTDIKPVQNHPRRVPVVLKSELKAKLADLEQMEVITKVNSPTPWINSMVAIQKPGKLRVCLDPLHLNKAVLRNHYPSRTIEEIAPRLSEARIFSVVDAKDGFLQVLLDEESSYLTTFWTPFGRYRWLRMPFGIKSAPEEFQRRLDESLEGLENVEVIADDIVIYGSGKTDEEAERSHDEAFKALLLRCRERGLKLNERKLRFKQKGVSYMGHLLTSEGLKPDPEKIKAVQEMPQPDNIQAVQRLLGVVNYLAKFAPKLSTICEPLRRLTDKDSVFDWLPQHEEALQKIKTLITQVPVLRYYNVSQEVTIECDSSQVGLGAVLLQNGQPISYASRALSKTEQNYAQIEKECLAIVFATSRFEQYILGKDVIRVLSDHKPLMMIFKKSILTCPKRLQWMRLKLQKYNLDVVYQPGKQMYISDTLSRASPPSQKERTEAPEYLIYRIEEEQSLQQEIESINQEDTVFVTDKRLTEIRHQTTCDTIMVTLQNMITTGWPNDKTEVPHCIREYWPYRDELSTQNGIVYRGTRIVIPTSMRKTLIARAHASHMGIQYTINAARDIMYWPRMSTELKETVQTCSICQEYQPAVQKEPMLSHPIPTLPWQSVAADCFELDSQNYLVVTDYYSDYIELCELKNLTTKGLIKALKPIFATHGTPAVLTTDNGPNFASSEFKDFIQTWDIQHITSSPHHHQSNGKAESAVKIMKNIVKKSKQQGEDMWKNILEWRNTTTPNMTSSPAQLLMSRCTRSFVPCKSSEYEPKVQNSVTEQVIHKRRLAKLYHDQTSKRLPPLVTGQPVHVQTHPQQHVARWSKGTVTSSVAPRSYEVNVNGKSLRRNRIHIRDAPQVPNQNSSDTEPNSRIQRYNPPVEQNSNPESCPPVPSVSPPEPNVSPPEPRRNPTRARKPPERLVCEN